MLNIKDTSTPLNLPFSAPQAQDYLPDPQRKRVLPIRMVCAIHHHSGLHSSSRFSGVPDGAAVQSSLQTLLLHHQEGQETSVSSGGLGLSLFLLLFLFVCLLGIVQGRVLSLKGRIRDEQKDF